MAKVKINKNGEIRISNDIKLSQEESDFISYIAEGEIKGVACSIIGLVFAAISIGLIVLVPKSEEKTKKAENVIDVV